MGMDFSLSPKSEELQARVRRFVREQIVPVEERLFADRATQREPDWTKWRVVPAVEHLKADARAAGLWNLFLPAQSGLSTVEYAPLAEEMGRSFLAPEVFNCNAPDTGNMEVLEKYGSDTVLWVRAHEQLRQFLVGKKGWKEVYDGAYASIYVKP